MLAHVASLNEGWTAFWCPRYFRTESAIQIICGEYISQVRDYCLKGIGTWQGEICAKRSLPFSAVDRQFIGDRYGEYLERIPEAADFAAQVRLDMALAS